ncbi:hypothetical protein EDB89DRAFT_2247229 [Lactarius sanguifluus]|nr:hypothetical protein EDB89DRAFT_2247229 [Lactarius sanguifluus]
MGEKDNEITKRQRKHVLIYRQGTQCHVALRASADRPSKELFTTRTVLLGVSKSLALRLYILPPSVYAVVLRLRPQRTAAGPLVRAEDEHEAKTPGRLLKIARARGNNQRNKRDHAARIGVTRRALCKRSASQIRGEAFLGADRGDRGAGTRAVRCSRFGVDSRQDQKRLADFNQRQIQFRSMHLSHPSIPIPYSAATATVSGNSTTNFDPVPRPLAGVLRN